MCRRVLDHSRGVWPSQQTAKHGTGGAWQGVLPWLSDFWVMNCCDMWLCYTLLSLVPTLCSLLLGGLGLWAPYVCDHVHVFMSHARFSVLKWQWWQHSMCLWRRGWCTVFWVFCISFPNSFLWFGSMCIPFRSESQNIPNMHTNAAQCQNTLSSLVQMPTLQSLHVCHNTCPTDAVSLFDHCDLLTVFACGSMLLCLATTPSFEWTFWKLNAMSFYDPSAVMNVPVIPERKKWSTQFDFNAYTSSPAQGGGGSFRKGNR